MAASTKSRIPWTAIVILLALTVVMLIAGVISTKNEQASLLFGIAMPALLAGSVLLLLLRNREIEFYREQYRAEVAQRAMDEGLNFAKHISNDIVLMMDDHWRILQASERVNLVYGYQPEEICHLTLSNLQTEASPSELEWQAEEMRKRGVVTYETIHRRKDYSPLPVECTSRAIKIDGKLYYQIVIHDITERRRAEMELRESESRFRIFYEQAPVAYHLLDCDGLLLDVNKSWLTLLGYARDEVIGKPFSSFINADTRPDFDKAFKEFKITGELQGDELEVVRSNGNLLVVAVSARANVDGTGNIIQAHCILHDITDKRLAEEKIRRMNEELEQRVLQRTAQLEAANKELEAFSYSVSHDLRAPLRAIDGFSKILSEEYAQELCSEAQHYLARVQENTHIMSNLIDNLLSFSRLSRQPLNKQIIDLKLIVEQSIELLTSDGRPSKLKVIIHALPTCQADPALVKQVYINLLSNAIKFTSKREKPCIEVGCLQENQENIYYVKDNGVGFDMQYVQKLFGVFQRLHRADEYEGTGVGLAIVQRIIHRHGGRIWATSELNQGATFCFTLEGACENG